MSAPRCARSLAIALVVASLPTTVVAEPGASGCVADYERGQELRLDGRLSSARDRLRACAASSCPALMRKQCTQWLADVDAQIPSIVIAAKGADGVDTSDVRVYVDGVPRATRLTGTPIEVDPGERVLRLETGGVMAERRLVLRAGEKLRRVDVSFPRLVPAESMTRPRPVPAAPPAAGGSRASGPPTASYVLGAVGVIGLASFAYFGISGYSRYRSDKEDCAPGCSTDEQAGVRNRLIVGDLSLGIGVASLAAAGWLWATRTTDAARPAASFGLSLTPTAGGARGGLIGRF